MTNTLINKSELKKINYGFYLFFVWSCIQFCFNKLEEITALKLSLKTMSTFRKNNFKLQAEMHPRSWRDWYRLQRFSFCSLSVAGDFCQAKSIPWCRNVGKRESRWLSWSGLTYIHYLLKSLFSNMLLLSWNPKKQKGFLKSVQKNKGLWKVSLR